MSPKIDNSYKTLQFPKLFTSSDDWLDAKRNEDGAEGLWRIHDKLYDFTIWARNHPGGKFWLEVTRGTDITEAFESLHFSDKPESLLKEFYIRKASTSRKSHNTFYDHEFLKKFKQKLQEKNVKAAKEASIQKIHLNDFLVLSTFLTAVLGVQFGNLWALISGFLLGILSTTSHDFLHMKPHWRVNYINLSLMSSREWMIRHVLSHHQYKQTHWDLEVSTQRRFPNLITGKSNGGFMKCFQSVLSLLRFATSAHHQFLKRFLDVFTSKKLSFHREELIGFILPLFLFCVTWQNPWKIFVIWNLIIFTGSFVFCMLNFHPILPMDTHSKKQDFGITQISLIKDQHNIPVLPLLHSYRNNILHNLCPSFRCDKLINLRGPFDETCREFGIQCRENDPSILDTLLDKQPQGHLFFS